LESRLGLRLAIFAFAFHFEKSSAAEHCSPLTAKVSREALQYTPETSLKQALAQAERAR
jgi:hypothetical protein